MKRSAKILLLIGLVVILFSSPVLAAAPPLTVQINGSVVNAPADMDVAEGQVMVPLRWAAEQLGANSVQWDSATQTITIKTQQDFYNMEKLASYVRGLQSSVDEQGAQICPLPEKAKNLHLSYAVTREWELELNRYKLKQLDSTRPPENIYIGITSDDGFYVHGSVVHSIENRQGHYYLPMDWLEYLFNAKVEYDQASNVLSIQTPVPDQIRAEITLIENALIPASADEAVKLWGRGEQTRNGALQYAALSPQLRREADKSDYVRQTYWVTGCSSPWVGPITIKDQNKLSDTKIEYTLTFPEITSNPPHTTATEKLVAEKFFINGREGWHITQIIQSSGYGIIDAALLDSIDYSNEKYGFSLLIPKDFADASTIKENGNIYFVNKEIQAMLPEYIVGVVGRIEVYNKGDFTRDNLKENGEIYGLRYLGENENYYFGWAHATDVQVPPDASARLRQQFRAMEGDFDKIIKTFKIIEN